MKHFLVNISEQTVTVNGETCNFQQAGLGLNDGTSNVVADPDEITEVLGENEDEDIKVTFE